MKTKLLLSTLLCISAASPPVRAEQIALSQSPDAGVCVLHVLVLEEFTIYVVHAQSPGATGSTWRITNSLSSIVAVGNSCGGLGVTGDPFTGIAVSYGGCLSGTFPICQLNFVKVTAEPIPGCYHLNVLPFPGEQAVGIVDCDQTLRSATGGYFSFDPNGKIPECDDCVVATEPTTWGAVKALYR